MKIKNEELLNLLRGLYAVQNVRNKKIQYNMARNKKALESELKEYNEAVSKIQKEHCEVDKNGDLVTIEKDGQKNQVIFLEGHEKEFATDIKALNESEGDISIRMITFADLEADTGDITPSEVDYLLFMIEDDSTK